MVYLIEGDPYAMGYNAYPEFTDNPFPPYTEEYMTWRIGWMDAETDDINEIDPVAFTDGIWS